MSLCLSWGPVLVGLVSVFVFFWFVVAFVWFAFLWFF